MKYVWVDNPTDSLRWTQNVRYFEGTFLDTYVYADPKIRNDAAAVQLLAAQLQENNNVNHNSRDAPL